MRITHNKQIMCQPTERDFKPEMKNLGGFGVREQSVSLVPLQVLEDSEKIKKGSVVYVKADVLDRSSWAKQQYKLDDKLFILVPEDQVVLEEVATK